MSDDECITKCFKANTINLHPTYLKYITKTKPYCFISVNEGSRSKIKISKSCKIDNNLNEMIHDIDYFIPKINFSSSKFLKNVYEILSWRDLLKFLEKNINDNHIFTIDRIISSSWLTFDKDYKLNLEIIIEIYKLYVSKFGKNISLKNKRITKIIYSLRKNNIDFQNIHNLIITDNV